MFLAPHSCLAALHLGMCPELLLLVGKWRNSFHKSSELLAAVLASLVDVESTVESHFLWSKHLKLVFVADVVSSKMSLPGGSVGRGGTDGGIITGGPGGVPSKLGVGGKLGMSGALRRPVPVPGIGRRPPPVRAES